MITIGRSTGRAIELHGQADYIADWEASLKEREGGILDMQIKSHFANFLRSEAGLQFYEYLNGCWGVGIFRQKFAYVNKEPFNSGRVTAGLVGVSSTFTVESFTEN